MSDTVRHPECPEVHLGVCPKCRRLYERDASGTPIQPGEADLQQSGQAEEPGPSREDVSPKSERLEVARTALTNAEKCHQYRERKKATDPDYLKRQAARKKEARRKARET